MDYLDDIESLLSSIASSVLLIDGEDRLVFANADAIRLLRLERGKCEGKAISQLKVEDGLGQWLSKNARSVLKGGKGTYSTFKTSAGPSRGEWKAYFGPLGQDAGVSKLVAVSLSIHRDSYDASMTPSSGEATLGHPVLSTPRALLILSGSDFRIKIANEVAIKAGAVVGTPLPAMDPPPSDMILELLKEVSETKMPSSRLGVEDKGSLAGEIRVVRFMVSPNPMPDGSTDLSCVVVNVTESESNRVRAVAAGAFAEGTRLRLILDALPIGIEVYDTQTGGTQWNERFGALVDRKEGGGDAETQEAGRQTWDEEKSVDAALRTGETVTRDVGVRQEDGSVHWALVTSTPVKNHGGSITGVVTTAVDVTRLHELQTVAVKQSEALSISNEELRHFAHVASHDLRQPLRAVSGFMELLKMEYGDKVGEQGLRYIERAIGGATRLQDVLDDLMTLYQVGTTNGRMSRVSLAKPLRGAIGQLSNEIQESGSKVVIGSLPTVIADEGQMLLLFQNLLENAIKFRSHDPPVIKISSWKESNEWTISVHDNGIGFDPKYAARIFEAFERLHAQSNYDGTGIGLAICRKIVTHHGGKIWFDSSPGKGSTFFFSLPEPGRGAGKTKQEKSSK